MKIRNDFVTNSSSSSFIISKENPFKSKENVYQFVKSLFAEFRQKLNMIQAEFPSTSIEEMDYNFLCSNRQRVKEIEKKYGVDFFDWGREKYFFRDDWYGSCPTYEKFIANQKKNHINYYDNGYGQVLEHFDPIFNILSADEMGNGIKDWYIEEGYDFQKEVAIYNEIAKSRIENDSAFCVTSECGYLPEYIVDQLSEISMYSCNHMG